MCIPITKKVRQRYILTSATLTGLMFPSYGHPKAQDTYLQEK